MRALQASDFALLDDFPLLWRWTNSRHEVLSAEVLTTVRVLNVAAAAAIALNADARCAEALADRFEMTVCAKSDEQAVVRARLGGFGIDPAASVFLSWDARTAAMTTWAIFVAHWDAFCYSSSDDVTIWAPDDDWTLCYRHFEVFQFGRSPHAV